MSKSNSERNTEIPFLIETILTIIAIVGFKVLLIWRFNSAISQWPVGFFYLIGLPALFNGLRRTFLLRYRSIPRRRNLGIGDILFSLAFITMYVLRKSPALRTPPFLNSALIPLIFLGGALFFLLKSLHQEISEIKS